MKLEESAVDLPTIEKCKVYKTRWLILFLFCLYSASNAMQWIEYSIIADVIVDFYKVEYLAVDWTSQIYLVLYIPFIFPASYILDKLGLRTTVILGMMGTCIGAWIKVASVSEDRFWVTFLGQSIVGFSQIFILNIPAKLAAVWFGPEQVSSACSLGVFGNQFGIAIGFLIPPLLVQKGDGVVQQLYTLFIGVATLCTVVLVLILIFFKDAPPTPPSMAQLQSQNEEPIKFTVSLKRLLVNIPFVLLLIAYGINTGIFYAISTLLNQIILKHYPDASQDAGWIGLVIVLSGMVGSVLCGVILDRWRRYKETTMVVYVFCLLSMIVYTFCLTEGIIVVYIISAVLGFFMTGLLPVGFELAAEITYPEPEGTSTGLMNASSQIFGIIFTSLYGVIFQKYNDVWANSVMFVMLGVGTPMTAFIKSDMKRQQAERGRA